MFPFRYCLAQQGLEELSPLGFPPAAFAAFSTRRFTISRSAMISSKSIVSMSPWGSTGTLVLASGLLVFWRYRIVANKQFGGLSGDLAGWFLQRSELWMLATLVACQLTFGGVL